MKKTIKAAICTLMAATMLFAVSACSEWTPEGGGPLKTGAQGKAIGLGHGNCITEVVVVVDGFGNAVKIQFDEIFPVGNVVTNVTMTEKTTVVGGENVKTNSCDTVTIGGKEYYKYLHIGDKYFVAGETANLYKEIGGVNPIEDLIAYCKTEAGVKWYYDSFAAGQMKICKEDAEKGTQVGDVKLSDVTGFNTANKSMRKRYSTYWNSQTSITQSGGLGFNGNMDMLENYLITYGFDKIDEILLPKKDGNNTIFNVIGGITTGATLSADTKLYLNVAKAAYSQALANQKDL